MVIVDTPYGTSRQHDPRNPNGQNRGQISAAPVLTAPDDLASEDGRTEFVYTRQSSGSTRGLAIRNGTPCRLTTLAQAAVTFAARVLVALIIPRMFRILSSRRTWPVVPEPATFRLQAARLDTVVSPARPHISVGNGSVRSGGLLYGAAVPRQRR
jgi:hypothetical protein